MAYKPSSDRILFFAAGFLTIFGLVMVYSASSIVSASRQDLLSHPFLRQLVYAVIGFVCLICAMNVDYHVWQKPKVVKTLLAVFAILLLVVFTQPTVNNAQRWLRYGSISIQPSEFAKLVLIIFAAAFLHKRESEINQPIRGLLPFWLVIGSFAALVGLEPDLGQAVCICLIAAIMLFAAGLAWQYMAVGVVAAIPAIALFVAFEPYRVKRILSFLDPFHDPLGAGWQIAQSLTAVGSGGVLGLGLGASKQKLFYLPEASSDFIFAVIGEELGLIGTSLVALAFLLFFYRGIRTVLRSADRFGFYLALGITLMVVLQGFINISMVLAMMPTKGIALPFMSAGGSSLLLNLTATGILLNISNQRGMEEAE